MEFSSEISLEVDAIQLPASFQSISYPESSGSLVSGLVARRDSGIREFLSHESSISYPESSGSLVSGLVARRDSGIMEFLSHESWDSGFTAHA